MNLEPITFVTFKWKPYNGYRSKFDGETVNVLYRMVKRHYHGPFKFVVLTDDATGITEPGVEIRRLWNDFAAVPNPSGIGNPSCYRRLRLFAENPGEFLGERFACLDLDMVITGDITAMFNRPEDFLIWRSCTHGNPYCGAMWYLRAGARPQVWRDFDPVMSPIATKRAKIFGSDQAWIAYSLGPDEAVWDKNDGVYSFRLDLAGRQTLPAGVKVVQFHGKSSPWEADAQRKHSWIKDHYR